MFLKIDETAVNPPRLQLFDHAVAGVRLLAYDAIEAEDEFLSRARLFAQVTLGTVIQPEAVCVETKRFTIASIPTYEEVYERWRLLRKRWGEAYQESYIDELLKCVRHYHRLCIEFRVRGGTMWSLRVYLGDFWVAGKLPDGFNLDHYFGEASKLADQT